MMVRARLALIVALQLSMASGARADLALRAPAGDGKVVVLPSGLRYVDLRVGSGAEVGKKANITVHHVGRLLDGTEFDSSRTRNVPGTFQIGAGQLIKGWEEGVPGMRVGGIRRLIIPPSLGYGNGRAGVIPPDAVLVFEVEMLATSATPSPSPTPSAQ